VALGSGPTKLVPCRYIGIRLVLHTKVGVFLVCHRRTCLTILERAWSANFKMVWYVLLQPLRPELDGQDPFQISGLLCQTRKTPTLKIMLGKRTQYLAGKLEDFVLDTTLALEFSNKYIKH
jgi:hypothetical protein